MTERLPDELDQTARVRHRVASGDDVGARRRINWPAGASLTDDPIAEEIIVDFAAVTAAQSAQSLGVYASSQTTGAASSSTVDARSVSLLAAGAISAGLSAGKIVLSAPNTIAQTNQTVGLYGSSQTVGASSSSTLDARSVTLVGKGAVSVGLSAGSALISAPDTIAQTNQSLGLYGSSQTVGESSSSTVDARSVTIVGRGAVSAGLSAGSVLISAPNTIAQTNQAIGVYALSQSTAQSSSSTVDARSLSFNADGIVSVGLSGGSVRISATTAQSVQSVGVYALSQSTAQSSSSTVDARSLSFNADGIISVGLSGGSVRISATTAQSAQTIGVYASSQTVGQSSSSTIDARSFTHVGDGIVSVGMSAGSLRISATTAAQTNQSEGWYAVSNTTGASSSSTVDARSVSLSPKGILSAGLTNGSLQISAPAHISSQIFHSVLVLNTSSSAANTSCWIRPMDVFWPLSMSRIDMPFVVSYASAGNTSFGFNNQSWFWGIYTSSGSTLTPLSAGSSSATYTWQSSTGVYSSITGNRMFSFGMATALSPGQYFFAVQLSTANAGTGAASTALGGTYGSFVAPSLMGVVTPTSSASNVSFHAMLPFAGGNSVQQTNVAQTMQMSQVNGAANADLAIFLARNV